MEIISKKPDFYEYDAYRYGEPDKSLRWVREPYIVGKADMVDKDDWLELTGWFKNFIFPTSTLDACEVRSRTYNKNETIVCVEQEVVGIYPRIYHDVRIMIVPVRKMGERRISFGIDSMRMVPAEQTIELIRHPKNLPDILESYSFKPARTGVPKLLESNRLKHKSWYVSNVTDEMRNKDMVVENDRIFKILNTPVFYFKDRFGIGKRLENFGATYNEMMFRKLVNEESESEADPKAKQYPNLYRYAGVYPNGLYVIYRNPHITDDTDVLRLYGDEIKGRDVYNDIENFLWNNKKEPESVPDNNTKIINAGFDTKTSFRNM